MKVGMLFTGIFVLLAFYSPTFAADSKFVGVKKCKACHKKIKKDGNAYGIWQKTKHSKAFFLLSTPVAKQKALELGIKTDPQKSIECLICHTAGAGMPSKSFARTFNAKDGIQCENCHGAGSKYRKKKTMKQLRKERLAGGNKLAKKLGFTYGDKSTCLSQCHQPKRVVDGVTYINPSYQDFNFKERWEHIKHPMPKK